MKILCVNNHGNERNVTCSNQPYSNTLDHHLDTIILYRLPNKDVIKTISKYIVGISENCIVINKTVVCSSEIGGTICTIRENNNDTNDIFKFKLPIDISLFLGIDAELDTLNATIIMNKNIPKTKDYYQLFYNTITSIAILQNEINKLKLFFENSDNESKKVFHYMLDSALNGSNHTCLTVYTCTPKIAQKLRDIGFEIKEKRNDADTLCGYDIKWK